MEFLEKIFDPNFFLSVGVERVKTNLKVEGEKYTLLNYRRYLFCYKLMKLVFFDDKFNAVHKKSFA